MSTPQDDSAPDVQIQPGPTPSVLGQVMTQSQPMPVLDNSDEQATDNDLSGGTPPYQPGNRLAAVLGSIAKTISTGVSGIPAKGRSTFVTGLGQGARAEQGAEATENQIKMQDFENSVRLANLHNQDLELQNRTQEQQDAHQKFQDFQADYDEEHGISHDPFPNDGNAAIQHLQAQTAANGTASVAPGTHLAANGQVINVPSQDPETQTGLLEKYKALQVPLNLPALPRNAQFVPSKYLDAMTHKMGGYDPAGNPIPPDQLKTLIPAMQAQRAQLAKDGATQYQLGTLDRLIGIYQANDKMHSDVADQLASHQADLAASASAKKKQADLDVENDPGNQAAAAKGAGLKAQAIANAKPQKAQNTDENGNPVWVPGASADEKKKAELAENMVYNINSVASVLQRRPDLVGAVAGRFTNIQQMAGSNDPDIVQLGTDIHNIGMANGGIHGMRSPQQADDYANQVLNHFKNGPKGIYGGLKSSADSVQTFIDAARPSTYKTHSSQGGATRGMMQQGGQ